MGFRPVRHGKRRVFRGNQRPGNKKENGPANREESESVHTGVVGRGHGPDPSGELYLEFVQFCEIEPLPSAQNSQAAPCAQILNRIRAYNRGMDHSKLMVVDAFASQVEADLAKSALESAGIDATIQADRAGGMRDHLAWSGLGFKLLVREEDGAEARDVLQPLPESELVFVQAFRTGAEVDVAYSTLLSAGIVPTIQDTVFTIPLSLTSNAFGFRVLVRKEDAAKAREILTQPGEARTQQSG